MSKRQMHINLFPIGCGHHQAAWRKSTSSVERLGDISFYEEIAQIAEKGKLDAVFLADGASVDNIENGPRWFLEPLTCIAAMARVTTHIGLISTVSSTFFTPFHAARMLASLDHISNGRMGWNLVTSMYDSEARNHGYQSMPSHEYRYKRAEEFAETVLQLWDSWPSKALKMDRNGKYADLSMMKKINHKGDYFLVDGPLITPQPPQGYPVLFQAGASEYGRQLAAKHAEAIYAVAYDLESAQRYYKDIKRRVRDAGRSDKVPILPGLVTYVASTEAEAQAKRRELDELLPTTTSLQQLEMYIFQDCSNWDLDAPVPELPPLNEFKGPKGRYSTILRIIESEKPTLRELLGRLAAGGGHCTMIGTPDQIADQMELWFLNEGADGFNLMPPSLPDSVEDFIEFVVPELQKRGLFRHEYEHKTLRGHLGLKHPLDR